MNFKEMFNNGAEKLRTKEFLAFASFLILSLQSFAGGFEKKQLTKDDIKAVYAKYNEYAKTHQNYTLHTKVNDYDISMFGIDKGYEFEVVQNVDNTTSTNENGGTKVSTEHKKIKYYFVDTNADGEADNVYKSSSSSTTTTTTNTKTPVNVKSAEVKPVITPVFSEVVNVMDQTLKSKVK